jgi:hypothetical protein
VHDCLDEFFKKEQFNLFFLIEPCDKVFAVNKPADSRQGNK